MKHARGVLHNGTLPVIRHKLLRAVSLGPYCRLLCLQLLMLLLLLLLLDRWSLARYLLLEQVRRRAVNVLLVDDLLRRGPNLLQRRNHLLLLARRESVLVQRCGACDVRRLLRRC